jgi:KipI family sensor histidine kinase inhibitor
VGGVCACIPTYCALLVHYDPCKISYAKLKSKLEKKLQNTFVQEEESKRIFVIPVCYGGKFGEDLPFVAEHAGLSPEEVVRLHCGADYRIYMLGFLPGFAYLGGLDPKIFTPRLQNPRTKIPAGAVGIGGEQTGIYPLASPGGWRLIGQTPVRPYDPNREEPILYRAGDYIRFRSITETEFAALERQRESGVPVWEVCGGE